MKIALISSRKSFPAVLRGVAEKLRSEIINVEVEEFVLDSNLDIVSKVAELGEYDFVGLLVFYVKETADVKVLMEKIVDLELQGKKTTKFFKQISIDFDENALAKKIYSSIFKKLFGAKESAPLKTKESFSSLKF